MTEYQLTVSKSKVSARRSNILKSLHKVEESFSVTKSLYSGGFRNANAKSSGFGVKFIQITSRDKNKNLNFKIFV